MYHPAKQFHCIRNAFVLSTFNTTDLNIYFAILNFYKLVFDPVDMFPQSQVCIRVTCTRHLGVDMFPHTSKSCFSSFSEQSEPIFSKEKKSLNFFESVKTLDF